MSQKSGPTLARLEGSQNSPDVWPDEPLAKHESRSVWPDSSPDLPGGPTHTPIEGVRGSGEIAKSGQRTLGGSPGTARAVVHVMPITIGPGNALAATGFPWRWVRDQAEALGVPFVGCARKRGVRADLFLAALEQQGAKPSTPEPVDHAEQLRARLGKRRRTG